MSLEGVERGTVAYYELLAFAGRHRVKPSGW